MARHELAGKPAPPDRLANIPRLVACYYTLRPDPQDPAQRISFGTSGHRGSSLKLSFNEDHILAVAQAVCDFRRAAGITGPLFLGMDTHALSEPARISAIEVCAANGVSLVIDECMGYTPTPVISHAILTHNAGRRGEGDPAADGIVITPSHNPPEDGGFKYNPPTGGPADTGTTQEIAERANRILEDGLKAVRRIPYPRALRADTTHRRDFITPYLTDLAAAVDLDAVAGAGLKLAVDPMGGAAVPFWGPLAQRYRLDLEVVNPALDPRFAFMPLDHDGKIRMDCSSPFAMQRLIGLKDRFDLAFGNDADVDRHGIVTRSAGLLNPNHFLTVAVWYLFQHRPQWRPSAAIGKTLVSTAMIDRVAMDLGRSVCEVPVGFKWFVAGLLDGSFGFGGEESAGASFLRRDGGVWTTDKDGILLDLLAAEIMAVTGKDPGELYRLLEQRFGAPVYERIDAPATAEQKDRLKRLSGDQVRARELAGEPIVAVHTRAPGNGQPIGGVKVVTANGWFAARPSGTEDIYKIYAESFIDRAHLRRLQEEAQQLVSAAFAER